MQLTFASLRQSTGFWITLGLFVAANLASAFVALRSAPVVTGQVGVGFPFPAFIVEGAGDGSREWQFYWTGWLLDVLVALTLSVLVAALQRLFKGPGNN